jgi:hypothetical protein
MLPTAPWLLLAVLAAVAPVLDALVLQSSNLTVTLDDLFPRPLLYAFAPTGETVTGALTGWGHHVSLSLNGGAATCGESGLATAYTAVSAAAADFSVTATCVLHWSDSAGVGRPVGSGTGLPLLQVP